MALDTPAAEAGCSASRITSVLGLPTAATGDRTPRRRPRIRELRSTGRPHSAPNLSTVRSRRSRHPHTRLSARFENAVRFIRLREVGSVSTATLQRATFLPGMHPEQLAQILELLR